LGKRKSLARALQPCVNCERAKSLITLFNEVSISQIPNIICLRTRLIKSIELMRLTQATQLFSFIVITGFIIQGCEQLDGYFRQRELYEDMGEIFRQYNIAVESYSCSIEGASRAGSCLFTISDDQKKKLVEQLDIKQVSLQDDWRIRLLKSTECYAKLQSPPISEIESFESQTEEARSFLLRRKNGKPFLSFSSVSFLFSRASKGGCLHFIYGWM
jgi:hypothetical protein